ncbi:MAG: DUF3846 domain-containing protein [Clostridia bacterium]|nr:DUF3846 domain-containing protein [Clostridia bacterium]
MKIRIYQIDLSKDAAGAAFSGLVSLAKRTGSREPDGSIYRFVWEGDVMSPNLEDVYDIFNNDLPEDFEGRTMSVSDIVEIVDDSDRPEEIKAGFYYCDSIGFSEVNFLPPPAVPEEMSMKVIVVEPGKKPYTKTVLCGLKSLQEEVDGYIECVYPFDDPVALIVNEEGKINGMPLNRALRDDNGDIYDIIAGTFLVVGLTDEDFCSLDDCFIGKYSELFENPELFVSVGGRIHVLPDRSA